jgi:tetratricopeptide (TPR) repeat protein
VEEIAAIEVEFDFIRQSDGSKIIPTQTFRNYFYKKWGGDDEKSNFLLKVIDQITKAQGFTNSFFAELEGIAKNLEQQVTDPYEFEAKGLHLKHNPEVPWVSLDIQNFIVSKIAREFAQKISKTHEIASLELASGDHQGIILIQGNAYELAINHLENLPQPLSPANSYNLGLAYEAIGEYTQAAKHYQNGLKREVDNSQLKEALLRVKR